MTQKTTQNPWLYDVRVRERNLRQGALDEKELERYLSQLPDAAGQAEAFAVAQPALEQPEEEEDEVEAEAAQHEAAPEAPAPAAPLPSDTPQ